MTAKADFPVEATPGSWDLALTKWLEIRNENPLGLPLIGVIYTSRGGL